MDETHTNDENRILTRAGATAHAAASLKAAGPAGRPLGLLSGTSYLKSAAAGSAAPLSEPPPPARAVLGDLGNVHHRHHAAISNASQKKPSSSSHADHHLLTENVSAKKFKKAAEKSAGLPRTLVSSDHLLRQSIQTIKASSAVVCSPKTLEEHVDATLGQSTAVATSAPTSTTSTSTSAKIVETAAASRPPGLSSTATNNNMNDAAAVNCTLLNQKRPSHIPDIDILDAEHPEFCSEYAHGIYLYLRSIEAEYRVDNTYMKHQPAINAKMRAVLLDWLVDVHLKFKLLQETLYLCVNIIDRFLAVQQVARDKLQLVGVTAMMIAAKFEEIYSPEINDFIYITDDAYTRRDILDMEMVLLNTLGFKFGAPSALHFLRRCSKAAEAEAICHTLAKYLIELTIIDLNIIKYPASVIAAASLLLAQRMLNQGEWDETMEFYSGYSEDSLTECMLDIFKIVCSSRTSSLKASHKKYSNNRFYRVSLLADAQCNNLRVDPQ